MISNIQEVKTKQEAHPNILPPKKSLYEFLSKIVHPSGFEELIVTFRWMTREAFAEYIEATREPTKVEDVTVYYSGERVPLDQKERLYQYVCDLNNRIHITASLKKPLTEDMAEEVQIILQMFSTRCLRAPLPKGD